MSQKLEGELVEWDDARGFGFIRPDGERDWVFIHIKSIKRIVNRPRPGDRLRFNVGVGRDGRSSAVNAEIIGANPVDPRAAQRGRVAPAPASLSSVRPALTLAITALVAAVLVVAPASSWLALLYLGAGVISIAAYWIDKRAAESSSWRIPEKTLHLIDIGFGIAGGLIAQHLLRHKTSKASFATVTYGIAALHLVGLVALAAGLATGSI